MILIIAYLLILTLVYLLITKPNKFLFYLIMIKPFIDLTVNVTPFGSFNALEISGILVFFYTTIYYFNGFGKNKYFNHGWIWLFLILNVFAFYYAFLSGEIDILSGLRLVSQLYGSFFIYFLAYKFLLSNFADRVKMYRIIWLSIFITGIINLLSFLSGNYSIDITGGVTRAGGIYTDPGTPSYLSVIAIIFATIYIKINRNKNLLEKGLYVLTWGYMLFTQYITLTKSAVLMLLVFLVMWLGFLQKKSIVIIPLLLLSLYYSYKEITVVQIRLKNEIEFIKNPSDVTVISVGTGRVGVWKKLLNKFNDEYTLFQKIFGNSKSFGAHNQYIAYLMQIGILGLLVFVFIIYKFYRRLVKLYRISKSPEVFTSIIILSCFMVQSITGHPFGWTTLLWYLMIMLGLANVQSMNALNMNGSRLLKQRPIRTE